MENNNNNNHKSKAVITSPPATCSSLVAYLDRHMAWSLTTFGSGSRTKGLTAHIRKELLEIEAAPYDLEEWIDVVILALDGAWRAGYMPEQIVTALHAKQAKNFKRTYPNPESQDRPSEHIREASNAKAMASEATADADCSTLFAAFFEWDKTHYDFLLRNHIEIFSDGSGHVSNADGHWLIEFHNFQDGIEKLKALGSS
jgi:hypothetical protein